MEKIRFGIGHWIGHIESHRALFSWHLVVNLHDPITFLWVIVMIREITDQMCRVCVVGPLTLICWLQGEKKAKVDSDRMRSFSVYKNNGHPMVKVSYLLHENNCSWVKMKRIKPIVHSIHVDVSNIGLMAQNWRKKERWMSKRYRTFFFSNVIQLY